MSSNGFLILECFYSGILLSFVALGYSLIYGVLRFVNFAHGDLLALSTLVTISLEEHYGSNSVIEATIVGCLVGAILGLVSDLLVYRPFRGESPLTLLLSSFSLAAVVQALMRLTWGARSRVPSYHDRPITLGGIHFEARVVWLLIGSVFLAAIFDKILHKTTWGLGARAYASDPVQARRLGLPVNRIISSLFFLSGALSGVAGVLLSLSTGASPDMGFHYSLWAFAATIIGGLGSVRGTFVGGFLLGCILSLITRFFSVLYLDFLAFAIMGFVLLWRPQGLLSFLDREV